MTHIDPMRGLAEELAREAAVRAEYARDKVIPSPQRFADPVPNRPHCMVCDSYGHEATTPGDCPVAVAHWAAIDARETAERDDARRPIPTVTRWLVDALTSNGVTVNIAHTGGGCEALSIVMGPVDADGFADEILIASDGQLPSLGQPIYVGHYQHDDDPIDIHDDWQVSNPVDVVAAILAHIESEV